MVDDTELPFTLFVAGAQLIVGIGLLIFATSAAVRIIGGVIIAFALLTGGSAWYHARQRGQRLFGWFSALGGAELTEPELEGTDLAASREGAGEPGQPWAEESSSQGPRQPPDPDGSRSASGGPQVPGS